MKRLYVYGIVGATSFDDPLPNGHDEASVFALVSGDIAVAVSFVERSAVEASAANVWLHDNVLSALMTRYAVLPMRFGTIAVGATQLLEGIVKRQKQLMKDLMRLNENVEIALHISGKNWEKVNQKVTKKNTDQAITQGTAYLLGRQQSLYGSDKTQLLVQNVRRAIRSGLDPLMKDVIWPIDKPQALPFKASCLINRNDVASFVQIVNDIAAQNLDARVTCTGPWAPYSFVGKSGVEGET
ncbi:GvpL/GvpF-family gas vesicle protein 4 [Octadecabacter antarcticus 307]|uniref:GvpL/GvpF-family gas vesicle protein 4 n=1 Tax=Octadecabacter antarcticus 307 TaxID=391626 RepID=M9R8P1_9RHOB|nr:GvpL/GvpF family gas vesicle protein [Octadecabacter antarcticus]AGI68587.1 GvpL/GvpF-family gas vesicle protein 4 [Octadecabacter antarcticus 307]